MTFFNKYIEYLNRKLDFQIEQKKQETQEKKQEAEIKKKANNWRVVKIEQWDVTNKISKKTTGVITLYLMENELGDRKLDRQDTGTTTNCALDGDLYLKIVSVWQRGNKITDIPTCRDVLEKEMIEKLKNA